MNELRQKIDKIIGEDLAIGDYLEALFQSELDKAVQAFGEKVLKESITVLPETFPSGARQSIDAVPASVITSLMKGANQ